MRHPLALCALATLTLAAGVLAQPATQAPAQPAAKPEAQPAKPAGHSAISPAPRPDEWWTKRHEAMNARVKHGNVEMVFIGDSITQGWENEGKKVWQERFESRYAVNLGIGGDRTQHVLWRLDHGNLEGIAPKAAVIMIGTNNSNGKDNTAVEIADGVKAIVAKVHEKSPETRILLLAIFPRGEKPNPQRDKIREVNDAIKTLDNGKTIRYLDIGPKFLEADGTLPRDIMPDFLHLSERGYQIWADAIQGPLDELLKAE